MWVTTLDNARLANGTHVEVRDFGGKVLWQGETDQNGIARPVGLPEHNVLGDYDYGLLAPG